MASYVERFLGKFEGVRDSGPSQWKALCPAHPDKEPSLHISLNEKGELLAFCHAGCQLGAVLEAAGLTRADLYPGLGEEPILGAVASRAGRAEEAYGLGDAAHHEVYAQFLAGLDLSKAHRDALRRRGLTDDQIDAGMYRTLGKVQSLKVIRGLVETLGQDRVLQAPGFRLHPAGHVEAASEAGGLLIPARHPDGRIQAILVRSEGHAKYRWLAGAEGKSLGGVPAHVPLGTPRPSEAVRVVEGVLKADVVRALDPSVPTIGIGGATSWRAALPVLEHLGAKEVFVAFDADWRSKQSVREALEGLVASLRPDYEVMVDVWDEAHGKGLDDALYAGHRPARVSVEEALGATPPKPQPSRATGKRRIRLKVASEVKPEPKTWVWKGWIPEGAITLLEGEGAVGKGYFTYDLIARLTVGSVFPPDKREPGRYGPRNVLMVTSEDSYSRIIVPGLAAAGADLDRVHFLETVEDEKGRGVGFVIPRDLEELKETVRENAISLIVIDPLTAFLDAKVDINSESEARQVLGPLFDWLDAERVSLVTVRHYNKRAGDSYKYRGLGSVAFTNQARSVLAVIPDPDDEDKKYLLQTKANWNKKQPALVFHQEAVATIPGMVGYADTTKVVWDGEEKVDLRRLMRRGRGVEDEPKSRAEEAAELLEAILADGPVAASEVERRLTSAGFGRKTKDKAAEILGAKKKQVKSLGTNIWVWSLPEERENGKADKQT